MVVCNAGYVVEVRPAVVLRLGLHAERINKLLHDWRAIFTEPFTFQVLDAYTNKCKHIIRA